MTSLEEENASLKVRLRHMDGLELERDELVRQLDSAKEDLFNEQRQSRNKVEELQEVSYLPLSSHLYWCGDFYF
jgi:hypothetical protein